MSHIKSYFAFLHTSNMHITCILATLSNSVILFSILFSFELDWKLNNNWWLPQLRRGTDAGNYLGASTGA